MTFADVHAPPGAHDGPHPDVEFQHSAPGRSGARRMHVSRMQAILETAMSIELILVIVLVVFLLGGGGFYFSRR
jgi:hypothetical protein